MGGAKWMAAIHSWVSEQWCELHVVHPQHDLPRAVQSCMRLAQPEAVFGVATFQDVQDDLIKYRGRSRGPVYRAKDEKVSRTWQPGSVGNDFGMFWECSEVVGNCACFGLQPFPLGRCS